MTPRLALVIHSLGSGGAERVVTALAGHWAERGAEVTLVTFDDGSAPPFFPLPGAVRRMPLGIAGTASDTLRAAASNLRRVRALRAALGDLAPDAAVAFFPTCGVLTLLASRRAWPVVVSERIDPAWSPIPRSWSVLRRLTYPWANRIVVQTENARRFFSRRVQRRTCVIPNAVAAPVARPEARDGGTSRVVALGRLVPQKGFDLLLQAFARAAATRPGWSLEIWGEGAERARLSALADGLGLAERVRLPGLTRDTDAVLRSATLFVLSSRFEGFPNALCEAMAHGVAPVAFDCPSGPAECVRHEVDGLLVPAGDVAALAAAMARLMDDPVARAKLGARAREIVQRFGSERIFGLWDSVLARAGVGFARSRNPGPR